MDAQGLHLAVMSRAAYAGWRDGLLGDFADELVATGVPEVDASDQAEQTFDRLLPEGARTPDNFLWTVMEGAASIGVVWMHLRVRTSSIDAIVRDLHIEDRARRQGRGRAVVELVEREARARGADALSMRFFGGNIAAQTLCESLGFRVSSITMRKQLTR